MTLRLFRRVAAYRRLFPMIWDFCYDYFRFARFSSASGPWRDEEKLRASITALYHNIEKGLSLRHPRPGFGVPVIRRLLAAMGESLSRFGPQPYLLIPLGALESYFERQRGAGVDVEWLADEIKLLRAAFPASPSVLPGGVVRKTREQVLSEIQEGGLSLLLSRSSCRQFSSRQVDPVCLERAVRVAQKAPVVCNRQSGRIYSFKDKSDVERILMLQGGARGFASEVPLLLCITVDWRNFNSSAERYQGWIDGGLFAMSLIFGLHAQGLGTCCLNWSRTASADRPMRKLIDLPDTESIIMFLAVGYFEEEFLVAASERKPVHEVLIERSLDPK